MDFRSRPGRVLFLALLLTLPRALAAQGNAPHTSADSAAEKPHPLVTSVTFTGVHVAEPHEILATLSTLPTTCKPFILPPFCALTHSHLCETRHYLDRAELPRDALRVQVFYWLHGYRHAAVSTAVKPSGRGVAVTFAVTEGPPTLIQAVAVTQTRPPTYSVKQLQKMALPHEGEAIDLTQVDTVKARVRSALWDQGYGNAEVRDSVRPVDSLRVALEVAIDPGPRTTVDTVVVVGNERVTSRTVHRLVGLGHGDLYKRSDLLEAQRRLYRSELFRQALIAVPDSADSAKKVVVSVREAPMHAAQLGGGFSTVQFGQAQANYTLYNWIGSARRLDLHSSVGNLLAPQLYGKTGFGAAAPPGVDGHPDARFLRPTWQVSATVSQPWLFSTMNSVGLTVFAQRRSIPGIVVDWGNGASATFTRQILPRMPVSLTYRFERARVEAGELYFCVDFGYCRLPTIDALQQWNNFAPLVLTLTADRTDDPLEPTTGYTAHVDAEYASSFTASTWRYDRLQGEMARYLKVGKGVLVLHGNAGRAGTLASTGSAFGLGSAGSALLHPRVRFYAGGARSVRGYAEGQLGPRVLTIDPAKLVAGGCTDATIVAGTCDPSVASSGDFVPRPVGGSSLLEGTIEYRRSLGGNLGGALFVDAGRVGAGNLPAPFRARSAVTPGIGLRYSSPIGPVRIDLGLRPMGTETLPVVTQVRDSAGLRLVQLQTPMRYDPLAGAHGLARLTSHLQLHLYIGEAY